VLDTEGRFVYINQACYKIWGYQPEELIGISCFDLMVEEDREVSFQATREALQGAFIPTYENRYYRKDGSIVTMFWEGGWDLGDQLSYSTGRDITEQRQLEVLAQQNQAALATTKKQLESLIERITDGFLGLDENARVIYWNKAAETISRLPQQQMVGYSLWDVLPEPTRSLAWQQLEVIKTHQRPLHVEYFSERVQLWIELNAYISETGVSVFFRDVTERKKLQEQLLQEKEERLREQQQQQKKITTAVIKATEEERALVGRELHDNVNQVLTTVKLYNELCRDGVGNVREMMDKSIALLQASINEIRHLSKRLSAPTLGHIKLKDSVKELLDTVSATNRICITIDTTGIDDLELDQETHISLYRIFQGVNRQGKVD
jgi:PAS domain S-box-containing protein